MTEERTQRRLTAILAADVVGYSRLMSEDEEGTLIGRSHEPEIYQQAAEHRQEDGGKKLGIGDLKIGACIHEARHRSGTLSEIVRIELGPCCRGSETLHGALDNRGLDYRSRAVGTPRRNCGHRGVAEPPRA